MPLVASTLILNDNNGKVTGSYLNTEQKSNASLPDGETYQLGYINCMNSAGYLAQMKKSAGALYSLTALPYISSIKVTFSTKDKLYLSVYEEGGTGKENAITSDTKYDFTGDMNHFSLKAGTNVVYVSSIEITYNGEVTPSEESSSSSDSSSLPSSSSSSVPSSSSSYSYVPPDPGNYYGQIGENLSGANLKTALFHLIDGHTNKGYDYAYTAYPDTDVDDDGKIIDIYSSYRWDPDKDHHGAPGKGNYDAEGQMFNREHTIPQSVFNEGSPMKADLHHLLPTDAYVNNRRSNYPHAEVGTSTYTSSNGCKLGSSKTPGYSGTAFEVIDEYKGDIARIYFYMVTRYQDKLSSWKSYEPFSRNAFPSLASWAKDLYLKWSDNDPVSEKEIRRNEAIYAIQENRNPFIDHPEYAHRIWD